MVDSRHDAGRWVVRGALSRRKYNPMTLARPEVDDCSMRAACGLPSSASNHSIKARRS